MERGSKVNAVSIKSTAECYHQHCCTLLYTKYSDSISDCNFYTPTTGNKCEQKVTHNVLLMTSTSVLSLTTFIPMKVSAVAIRSVAYGCIALTFNSLDPESTSLGTQVEFMYHGHQVKVKVTGAKDVQSRPATPSVTDMV